MTKAERRERGLCVDCNATRQGGRVRCFDCGMKHRERMARYNRSGASARSRAAKRLSRLEARCLALEARVEGQAAELRGLAAVLRRLGALS